MIERASETACRPVLERDRNVCHVYFHNTIGVNVDPREFESLEADFETFDIRIDGVPVWERIRFGTFQEIQERNGVGQAQVHSDEGIKDQLKGFALWLKNGVHRNPFLAESADMMVVGNPRRKKLKDGLWWDIYTDPIHEASNLDSVHFELPYRIGHQRPAKTEGVRYLDLIQYGGHLQRKLNLHRTTIPSSTVSRLNRIEQAIAERFDVHIDLEGRIAEELRNRRSTLWLYDRLLKRVNPSIVVLICSYGKETIIEACQGRGIPVVELQHGVLDRYAFGYHFPGYRTKETFPDYFLTWGEHWNKCAELPINDSNVITVGYPFLEQERKKYDHVGQDEQVLFISQGTVGRELSKLAVEVSKRNTSQNVVYKLHPGEYDRWTEEYPWLRDSTVSVIDDDSKQLYQLFSESSAQVGAYSTAIYEGLWFDIDTYLLNVPRVDQDGYLQENDFATVIDSPDELVEYLNRHGERTSPDLEPLFRSNATENVCSTIAQIARDV